MKLSNWLVGGVVLGAFAAAVPAQRVQLSDGSGREVVVLDVGDLFDVAGRNQGRKLELPAPAKATAEAADPWNPARLAALVRVAAGTGGAKGDLQPLGAGHLVAMGDAQWIGGVESFLRDARANAKVQFLVEVQLVELADASKVLDFDNPELVIASPRDGAPAEDGAAAPDAMFVLDGEAAAKFTKKVFAADGNESSVLEAPRLLVNNLSFASMVTEEQIAYVRDFTVRELDGASIAEPVVDTVVQGTRIETVCAMDKDGKVLVDLSFRHQVVDKPIAEWKTKIGVKGQELTVQLPRAFGCKASMKLLLAPGSTVVVPSKRSDGKWLLVMAKVQRVDQEAKPR
jgi:hypothetical protein